MDCPDYISTASLILFILIFDVLSRDKIELVRQYLRIYVKISNPTEPPSSKHQCRFGVKMEFDYESLLGHLEHPLLVCHLRVRP